ncbi:hypothetical protein ACOMHN_064594 [Nucella lapillus]
MFWAGQDGYNLQVKYTNGKVISAMDFYSYLIMERGDDNHILKFRQLLNQFLVDMFAKIETDGEITVHSPQPEAAEGGEVRAPQRRLEQQWGKRWESWATGYSAVFVH